MKVSDVKKGKQKKFVNHCVKKMDEEPLFGENLLGEINENIDIDKKPHIIQLGNLRKDRREFRNPQDGRVISGKGCCITLTLCMPPNVLIDDNGKYKVRALSGYEELLLMGVPQEDVDKIVESGLSNGQMRQLAGNSIVVDVMSEFFKEMIKC